MLQKHLYKMEVGAPDKLNLTVLYGNGPQEYSLGILAVVIIPTKNQQLVG